MSLSCDEPARARDNALEAAVADGEREPVAVGLEHACARADLVNRPLLRRTELREQVDHVSPGSDVFSAHDERDGRTRFGLGIFTQCLRTPIPSVEMR